MTMPTWDQTMFPILQELADGSVKDSRRLRRVVMEAFGMTADERNEMLKSGQSRIVNRVGWGITDLRKAELIESGEKRGTYRITEAGNDFLNRHRDGFTRIELETVDAFIAWKNE